MRWLYAWLLIYRVCVSINQLHSYHIMLWSSIIIIILCAFWGWAYILLKFFDLLKPSMNVSHHIYICYNKLVLRIVLHVYNGWCVFLWCAAVVFVSITNCCSGQCGIKLCVSKQKWLMMIFVIYLHVAWLYTNTCCSNKYNRCAIIACDGYKLQSISRFMRYTDRIYTYADT